MIVLGKIGELQKEISTNKAQGKTVGFVPTMGALHEGHLSLVKRCKGENDLCVVSIFVNPTQFNDKEDLDNYPRELQSDLQLLESVHCDIVFTPAVNEMYPVEDTRIFDFGLLDKVMEGAHRMGHFNGVAQIVTKLFDAVKPHRAYFGEKDFQQLAIIKKMVRDFQYPIDIIGCPIIRESSGLAMSSRNKLLNLQQCESAAWISKTLFQSKQLQQSMSVEQLKNWVINELNKINLLKVDYFEIVDRVTLQPVTSWNDPVGTQGCIAVKVGRVRLIDNIKYNC